MVSWAGPSHPGHFLMNRIAFTVLILAPLAGTADEPVYHSKSEGGTIELSIGAEVVTRYHIGSDVAKPYFWPLNAPGQIPVTRGWPMVKGQPKESNDHVHQKSAWFCHGDVIPEG